jgi:Fic family protein
MFMAENRLTTRLDFDFKTSQKILSLISQIDSLNARWQTRAHLSPQLIHRLVQSVLITSSGASTRIEGSLMSDEAVTDLYKKLRIKKFKTRDEQEVAGYLEVLQRIFTDWKHMPFSEGLIKQIHNWLLEYSDKDSRHKGGYKFQPNRVEARDQSGNLVQVIFNPTEPYLVPKEMQELVEWIQITLKEKELHPLLVIANGIFEYLAIHPFSDGNGRSSRLLTNLLLLQAGYDFTPFVSHEKIIESNKIEYYQTLNKSQRTWKTDQEDISPWLLFFLDVTLTQATKSIELLDKDKRIEIYLSQKQLAVWETFGIGVSLSRSEIQVITDIPLATVRQAIAKLVDMKLIESIGSGRATRYQLINK